jgi:hypothetical protein
VDNYVSGTGGLPRCRIFLSQSECGGATAQIEKTLMNQRHFRILHANNFMTGFVKP